MLFETLKNAWLPTSWEFAESKVKRWYFNMWKKIEDIVFKEEIDTEKEEKEEEKKIINMRLSGKYARPYYTKQQIHSYIKPFLLQDQSSMTKTPHLSIQ